jgi:hypothetical protein
MNRRSMRLKRIGFNWAGMRRHCQSRTSPWIERHTCDRGQLWPNIHLRGPWNSTCCKAAPRGPATCQGGIGFFKLFSPSRVFTFGGFTVVVKEVKAACWVLLVQGGLLQVRLIYLMATLARRKVPRSSVFEANLPWNVGLKTSLAEVCSRLPSPIMFGANHVSFARSFFARSPNLALRGRGKTSDTFSSAWQARYFVHVAKTLAGAGGNQRWFLWQAQY